MSIDFHSEAVKDTYAHREAHADWAKAMEALARPAGKRVVDVGCGGGIYSLAWADLGAARVTGVDFSEVMVDTATRQSDGRPGLSFQVGAADDTGLPAGSADVVFERALIHHLADYTDCFREAARLLSPGGMLLVQDRTVDDVRLPGSAQHIRGYFFECFPRLAAFESGRRPSDGRVRQALEAAGFGGIESRTLWETRRTYGDFEALASDLRARTGRSILHELSDAEIEELIGFIRQRVPAGSAIVEQDRWTIWSAIAARVG
ncbi:class I SAM-dependent methyltransferase [Bordetella genomosp. 11]|uniref:SAM-dependent methyltransferase n=1 Tax=Bordetella genomosp. 11 TaxID=1416808 RepID=A0A261UZ17_9BORD|nr:class I SAM-dependent methyltransferase [Bordetella genomosp. 11]OZI66915.1 SAM-dependent methyltransferase [Bordetella genomosp. 11]